MSIRRLANQGFSLHNILGTSEDVDVGNGFINGSDNGRLFDFRGRLPDQHDQSNSRESEIPQGRLRLKNPLSLTRPEVRQESKLSSPESKSASSHRVTMLERQLNDAKERMQMLNQDRTVRVRKAEEQARKAMSEERSLRSQLDHMATSHMQQLNDLNRDLQAAEAETKQLHEAYTLIDELQERNKSLLAARDGLDLKVKTLMSESLVMSELQDQSKALLEARDGLALQVQSLNSENLTMKRKIENVSKENGELMHQHQRVKDANESLTQQVSTMGNKTKEDNDSSAKQLASANKDLTESKQINREFQSQILKLELMLSSKEASQPAVAAQQDLIALVDQMRVDIADKDALYEQLKLEKSSPLLQPLESPESPESLRPQLAPCCVAKSQITLINNRIDTPHSAMLRKKIPSMEPTSLPRLVTGRHVYLSPQLYVPIASGPDASSDSNQDENVLLKLVIGDFREHIHDTLLHKGAIPPEAVE